MNALAALHQSLCSNLWCIKRGKMMGLASSAPSTLSFEHSRKTFFFHFYAKYQLPNEAPSEDTSNESTTEESDSDSDWG